MEKKDEQIKNARYDETDFNKLINESFDFLLVSVTKTEKNSHLVSVSMKTEKSVVFIITALLVENEVLRNEIMTNIMAYKKKNDKTIN